MADFSLAGYDVLEVLGRGGNAVVYRAWQQSVGREVAVKVGHFPMRDERDRRRFEREVAAAGLLAGHPAVVGVYDAGWIEGGRPYLVMQLCPGGSLGERLRAAGPLRAGEVRDVGVQIAGALTAAHERGVLHRDVKPDNLLRTEYGGVALADFGIATPYGPGREITATLNVMTPEFAAPEVFFGREPTAASDVYSLAASLYALLSGEPPRVPRDRGQGPYGWVTEMTRLFRLPVPDLPGVPEPLMRVLRGALASDVEDRPRDAAGFRDALLRAGGRPPRPEPAPRESPGVSRLVRVLIRRVEIAQFPVVYGGRGYRADAVDDLRRRVIETLRGVSPAPVNGDGLAAAALPRGTFEVAYAGPEVDAFLAALAEELSRLGFA
ncbi:serine/threonine-protein kinase [Bailinhaonella thermotolerans]|uniref:non-specific serine/threonine protein kinase n=1 Tax=Bailinhaonella thermotolerans TaxID=1070861 RepID=A0A3A4AXX2_9ACTN|nr:serine/threonine-protein kinase [Bailinhaonella thermotolerans]RJL33953.1 serine/threonine protein kinase [Bailinhaonella thermotolerans]